ncbi:MAG: glycosyl transferase family protein [Candidatus Midichloriaceae bacterium]|jgi:cellulose synthase/poly-beta-1,6-N-acetylglucosamine synthase-like glycosyltransferase|nr:glycosyl transferase family protein [Candidatus Midichloriaceae bacterium]
MLKDGILDLKKLDLSAKTVLTERQKMVFFLLALIYMFFLDTYLDATAYWTMIVFNCAYFFTSNYRLAHIIMGVKLYNFQQKERNPFFLTDDQLPTYTILVPLFHESSIIPSLINALCAFDYPKEKLQILIILEEEDKETLAAIEKNGLPSHFQTVIVPKSEPQTKPKACNYAMQFATGELTCIYDAEDRPDSLQLKIVANKFAVSDKRISCLQCRLFFYNGHENLLTSMFEIEYQGYYNFILPIATYFKYPLPLGGSSNHFKTDYLIEIGGWDPHNVTEDADLGMKFAMLGRTAKIIYSFTKEEAPITVAAWLPQRVRWLKGFFHTCFIYFRHPIQVMKSFKLKGVAFFLYILCLSPFLMITSPVVLILSAATYLSFFDFSASTNLMLILLSWVNFVSTIMSTLLTSYMVLSIHGHRYLRWRWMFFILYAFLLVYAAIIAIFKLFKEPHKWDKTTHGVTKVKIEN